MDEIRRKILKSNLLLPAFVSGGGIAAATAAQGSLSSSLVAGTAGPMDGTKSERLAGVTVKDNQYAPGNARRYGATGDGKTDDTRALQDAIDAASAANFSFPVYLPTGDYVINSPLIIKGAAPKSMVLIGDGGAFGIRNTKITVGRSWSGNSMIQSDGVRKNGWTIEDIWFDAGSKAKCILNIEELNYVLIRGCRIASAVGTVDRDGLGAITTKNSWVCRLENCVVAACGDGIYCSNSTNNLNVWGCSIVGNKGIGLRMRGCSGVNISGSVFEDNAQFAILLDICRGVWISGNYFEMNGAAGYRYRKGEERTIRADIVANGWISPEIKRKDPSKGLGIYGNYFLPPKDRPLDASIYLLAVAGFSEAANEVHWPYFRPAAFIKTKNDRRLYQATDVSLGNSFVAGVTENGGKDKYFDIDGLNDARVAAYDHESLTSIYIHPRHAPRFNAHEDLGFNPETYEVLADSGRPLNITKAPSRRMGRQVYFAECGTAGTSNVVGLQIPEADYDNFWDDELWIVYLEVQGGSDAAGFEIQVRIGDRVMRDGGRVAGSGKFAPRAVVFKPVAGSHFSFGIVVSGRDRGAKVAFSRPVICPLGVMHELSGPASN